MPPRRRVKATPTHNPLDALELLQEGIKTQIAKPNIYAYKPHDKQYAFHKSKKHIVLYIGGNRSGKTVGGAVETVYRLTGRHPYKRVPDAPVRGRAVAVDFNYGVDMIMIPQISQFMPPSFLINGSWEDSYDKEHRLLTLANKSFLEFRSYDQDLEKFAGTSRHFTWFDEEAPRHIYNECMARLIDTSGDAYLTMTPVEGMSWVFDDIYTPGKNGSDDIEIIEIEMSENPYISKAASKRYLDSLDPEERKARERGEFVAMGGKVFKSFNNELHVIPFEVPPKDWEWYISIDHGYNNPTAILWHAVSKDGRIITFSEHYKSEMTVPEHAQVIHFRNAAFERVPDIIVGDPAMAQRSGITGTSILQEYADRGIYIASANNDVDSGINRMIQYLSGDNPRWHITENCVSLIGEMKKLRWATFSSRKIQYEKNKQEKIHKKDDHACDSARYFFSFMPDLTPMDMSSPVGLSDDPLGAPRAIKSWDELVAPANSGLVTIPVSSTGLNTSWQTVLAADLYENE